MTKIFTSWKTLLALLPLASAELFTTGTQAQEDTLASTTVSSQTDSTLVIDDTEPYIVTASRVSESTLDTPYIVERIDDTVMIERAIRSVPEALEQTPGVVVQKTSNGQGSPIIRGFTAYHNLFLVDGIRLNNAAFRSGPNQYWNTVDSQGLSAIELVKSQGSVIYGADAVGGTLQAITRRPLYAESGFLASGRSYSRYASGENSYIQRLEASVSEAGKYGLIIGGTYKDFGNIRAAGLGTLPKTGYQEWDFDAKLEVFLNEDTRLTLFHQQVQVDNAWRTHKTIYGKSWRGTSLGNERARILDQDRMLSYIQLEGAADNLLFDHYTISLSRQQQQEERYRERSDRRVDVQGFDLTSYGAWAQFDRELDFTHLTYGASYYQDRANSYRNDYNADGSFKSRAIQGPIGDDGKYHLVGAFLNSSTSIGERLTADIGARYTYAKADIGKVQSPATGKQISIANHWSNVVGSGRLSWQLDQENHWRAFGGISQAFRAPNFSDLSRLDSNRSNEIETPVPNLDPEKFLTYEIGIKTQGERLSGSLSYYYTQVNDLILRTPTGRIVDGLNEVTKQNVGDGYVHGVELAGNYQINTVVSVFGGFAYQNSKVSTFPTSQPIIRDEPLSRLMPTNGYGGVRLDLADGKYWIEGLVTAVGRGDRLSTRDIRDTQRIPPGGTPAYWLATLRGGWQARDNILLTAAVENLADQAYRAHGSGQNEPGINVVLGAEIRF
ncbi:MAG: TonB-dependent receptor [Verrucomicrobiota bacterium]